MLYGVVVPFAFCDKGSLSSLGVCSIEKSLMMTLNFLRRASFIKDYKITPKIALLCML